MTMRSIIGLDHVVVLVRELEAGARRIVFLGDTGLPEIAGRFEGYRAAHRLAGIRPLATLRRDTPFVQASIVADVEDLVTSGVVLDETQARISGTGRDINRHRYTPAEIGAALERPVVRDLIALIRARNAHPAFGGAFTLETGNDETRLTMRWAHGAHTAQLTVDFTTLRHTLDFSG